MYPRLPENVIISEPNQIQDFGFHISEYEDSELWSFGVLEDGSSTCLTTQNSTSLQVIRQLRMKGPKAEAI